MKKCKHNIGVCYKYSDCEICNEKDVYEYIKEEVDFDYNCYLSWKNDFDFTRKNFFTKYANGDGYINLFFGFFDYCCDCGEKINKKEIKARINKKLSAYVKTLSRERIEKEVEEQKYPCNYKEDKSIDGYVYLVKLDKHYKIGIAQCPEQRLREFTLLPYKLEDIKIAKVKDNQQVEKDLHEKYKDKRVRGEWFKLNDIEVKEIVDYLTSIEIIGSKND